MIIGKVFKKFSVEVAWIISGQFSSIVFQLLILRLLTNELTVDDYGLLSLLLVASALIERTFMVVQAGISRYFVDVQLLTRKNAYWQASIQLLARSSIIALSFGSVIIFCIPFAVDFHHVVPAFVFLLVAIIAGWNTAFLGIYLSARIRSAHALFQSLDFALKFVFLFISASLAPISLTLIAASYLLSAILLLALQFRSILRLIEPPFIPLKNIVFWNKNSEVSRWRSAIWKYSSPFMAWGGFSWMQQSSDRFALETFSGARGVGFYSILFQLGYTPMIIIGGMVQNFLQPILYSRVPASINSRNANQSSLALISVVSSLVLLAVTFIASLLAAVFYDPIISFLVAQDFRSYSYLLPLVVLAGGVFAASQPFIARLMALKNTHKIFRIQVLFCTASITLNLLLAKSNGIDGVVSAVLISSIILWMAHFISLLASSTYFKAR